MSNTYTIEIDGKTVQLRLFRQEFVKVDTVKGPIYINTGKFESVELPLPGLKEPWDFQELYRKCRSLGVVFETVRSLQGFNPETGLYRPAFTQAVIHLGKSEEVGLDTRYGKGVWIGVKQP